MHHGSCVHLIAMAAVDAAVMVGDVAGVVVFRTRRERCHGYKTVSFLHWFGAVAFGTDRSVIMWHMNLSAHWPLAGAWAFHVHTTFVDVI